MMNILLPTDFSANSRNAAVYALQFFKEVPCHFHLLHVIPFPAEKMGSGYMSISPEVQEKFNELLDWLESIKQNQDHHFEVAYLADYFIEAVRTQVQEKRIDLILMGTRGSTNNKAVVIGKNTSDVMKKVKCPVLAISENAVFKEHKEILFPTDYSIHYENKMLSTLLNLASLSKANVKILEIFNSEREPSEEQLSNRNLLKDSFLPLAPKLQTYYNSKNSSPKKLFVSNRNIDMIVLAAKNLNLCQKFLQNKNSSHIPFINQLPLLVLHG